MKILTLDPVVGLSGYAPSWKRGVPSLPNSIQWNTCFVTGDAGANAVDPLTQCITIPGATTTQQFL
ncbi:MAG: hypothetical protein IPL22_06750 [Bacteroidetes bacterium]|nr:hypothetical protein [Bacteroidota bacterium]